MPTQSIVQLLAEALRVMQQLEGREVGRHARGVGLLLTFLLGRLDGFRHLTLSGLGLFVDRHLMLEFSDVRGLEGESRGRARGRGETETSQVSRGATEAKRRQDGSDN
jgi:hypothetical protein